MLPEARAEKKNAKKNIRARASLNAGEATLARIPPKWTLEVCVCRHACVQAWVRADMRVECSQTIVGCVPRQDGKTL